MARAIELGTSVTRECETLFGPDHPDTWISRHHLAVACFNEGRTDKAIDLHRRTLAARERILGSDHPDTVASRRYLDNAYQQYKEHGP